MKALAKMLCLALLLSVGLAACASNDIRWTEEVKLSDGRVIEIQRRVELTESGFPVQERGFRRSLEICYAPMKLRWKSKGEYVPDIFDIVDGKAYMHVPVYDCISCMLFGYPETDALYFVWVDGQWKRISHEEFPEPSRWNLLMSFATPREKEDPRGRLTLQDKERRPSSLRDEQKRFGWKRVNESGKGIGRCQACRSVVVQANVSSEILISDADSICKP